MNPILIAVLALPLVLLPVSVVAEEITTVTPQLVLPEPETVRVPLPQTEARETEAMSVIETETASARKTGCGRKETVYLTN